MDIRMRIFIGIVMIIALTSVCASIRKKRIDIRHALVWLIVGALLLLMDLFPSLLTAISGLLGFELPVNMLFFLGFLLSVMILFSLSVKVSRQSDQIKKLMQDTAILSERIEELEKEKKE